MQEAEYSGGVVAWSVCVWGGGGGAIKHHGG